MPKVFQLSLKRSLRIRFGRYILMQLRLVGKVRGEAGLGESDLTVAVTRAQFLIFLFILHQNFAKERKTSLRNKSQVRLLSL